MKDQRKNHSILKVMLLSVYLVIFLKPSLATAQNTESQNVEQAEQSQEELNQALFTAVANGSVDEVRQLLLRGAQVNAQRARGQTPLVAAIVADDIAVTQVLITYGADVNAEDQVGRSPLFDAARGGNKDMVELLITSGAEVNRSDSLGWTPLDMAQRAGNEDVIELLSEYGAEDGTGAASRGGVRGGMRGGGSDINAIDEYGRTSLHMAAASGDINSVELFIAQGARLDTKDNAGRVPLHYAAGARGAGEITATMRDVIRILLDNNADINAQDSSGWTPLHYAVSTLSKEAVQLLIDRGADIDIVDHRGCTPYKLIQKVMAELAARRGPNEQLSGAQERISRFQDIAPLVKRSVYYIATDGSDSNPGTLGSPFNSINAFIDIAAPGDTVWVRGGTYLCSEIVHIDTSGLPGKPICIRAYPGEIPILDSSGMSGFPLYITESYWHITDLVVAGVSLYGDSASHNILETLPAGPFRLAGGASYNIILNCDAHNVFDPATNGEHGDGFMAAQAVGVGNIFIGNRAWNNSDDGYDMWNANNAVRLERCYAWRNGDNIWNHPFFIGNGNGFKLGGGEGRHILIHCMAWGHHLGGFNLNTNETGVILYGCMAVDNSMNYRFLESMSGSQYSILRNNISDAATGVIDSRADSRSNSWNSSLTSTITDADFLSRDDSVMTAPRNPDGSIPYNNFLKLAPDSAAIDAGTDVNMPYIGTSPDLGAFEYDSDENGENYVKMLHQYVRDYDIDKTNEMLDAGTDINEKDWLGYVPLHWACYFGYSDLLSLLIDKGADPNLVSDTGRTCLEIATAMDYQEIEDLLKNHGVEK